MANSVNNIITQLDNLEKETKHLEPLNHTWDKLTQKVTAYAKEYIANLPHKKAFNKSAKNGQELKNLPFTEQGKPIEKLLSVIATDVDTPGINPASGGHLGYVPGGGIYPTALADYLAAVTNQYAGVYFAGPGAVQVENLVIRWLASLLGFPKTALGNLTSGGSIANLVAIVTARDSKGIKAKDIPKACIYLTSQVHHSVQKALRIAGLAEAQLRTIPVDAHYRMQPAKLKEVIDEDRKQGFTPFLIIASAGTTDTGAIDPLNEIAAIAKKQKLWFHIDAAYGGFFMLVDKEKHKFKGLEEADSVTIDPHKGLFLAYGLGAVVIKDVEALKQSHVYQASYMQDVTELYEEPSPADLSPELTKHFRGLRLWLPLQLFGINGFRKALEEKILLCNYFYQQVQRLGFEVGPTPELSICIYRYTQKANNPNEFNKKLVDAIQTDGRIFVSSTTLNGTYWIRLAVLVFRTHLAQIEEYLSILQEYKNKLLLEDTKEK